MNTSQLKRFAQDARRKLLQQVGAKLNFVLTSDSAELREKTEQLKQLRLELGRTTKEQLIEKVAYTWFNRLMALRFMDVNDYQPLGIRVITPKDGYTIPELLDEAKRGNIPEELKVNRQRTYDILDNRIPSKNPQNEAFKELLIAVCNHLHTTFPFLFEKINDYTELLLPDDLTSDFSIVKDVHDGMPIDDCRNVEIIGWLYQFYISEKKDAVFASKSKVKKEDIPAATQLFTPRWIVEYMVQNTLGKLWLQNRPKSNLRDYMPYFIESASPEVEDYLRIKSPEEIKFLDPASGSGHILVYAFDLFTKIYEEEGYNTSEIPKLIIENNLYGFEIDERASQLSALALMMKAREYHRRTFRIGLIPNLLYYKDLHISINEIKDFFNSQNIHCPSELIHDLTLTQSSTNFGSLILPQTTVQEIQNVSMKLNQFLLHADVFQRTKAEELIGSLMQLGFLGLKFHCVAANPPYMGYRKMNSALNQFVSDYLPLSKADLMSSFMERALNFLLPNGHFSMINFQSWMFLSSFDGLRLKILRTCFLSNLIHIGRGVFGSDSGTVAFSIQNTTTTKANSVFIRLFEREVQVEANDIKESKYLRKEYRKFIIGQHDLLSIPNSPISYWITKGALRSYLEGKSLSEVATVTTGLATGDNNIFIRFWYEVELKNTKRFCDKSTAEYLEEKWFPYNKGGEFRKWYGNQDLVINWKNNGYDIKELKRIQLAEGKITANNSKCWNESKYFLHSVSWTKVAYDLSVRYYPKGFLFDIGGCSIFPHADDYLFILGLLNSNLVKPILGPISPTVNFEPGQLKTFPIAKDYKLHIHNISEVVERILNLSKEEFNLSELNWSFQTNALIQFCDEGQVELEDAYYSFVRFWGNKFLELHKNEELLNDLLIKLYALEDEITSTVPLENITIFQDEIDRKSLAKLNKKVIREQKTSKVTNYHEIELPFIGNEIMPQLISYVVGCMLGRFSLDKEGLILANKGGTLDDYLQTINKTENECTFLPDKDNIIPILNDNWFEDDIVGKFYRFLKVTFGERNFNKNLAFIEEHIGKDIRNYFISDFYPDHIKRYKKRPIYWMFSSPKGSFNVLVYMHRYTPDTVSNILNKYLKEFIGKLNTRKEHLEHVQVTGSASDKTKAIKEIDNIEKMLVELHDYERDILYPLATERIEIDLDDGVLVNYNKFGKAVKEVIGLNDPVTKKKVKQFDWIDTSQIR